MENNRKNRSSLSSLDIFTIILNLGVFFVLSFSGVSFETTAKICFITFIISGYIVMTFD